MSSESHISGPTSEREVVESLDFRLLANLSDNFRSPYEALLELVDNALASRLEERPITVTITGSGRVGGCMKIIAKGGRGMGIDDLRDFLRWGKPPAAVGLNRYGQGGKAAIGYLGKGMRVRCNRFDSDVAYAIEDENWLLRPHGELKRFVPTEVPAAVQGEGVVQIDIVGIRRPVNIKRLQRELAWRYRPALVDGSLRLRVGNDVVKPVALPVDTQRAIHSAVIIDGKTYVLRGWVGIASSQFEGRGGVRCSAFGRVVLQNEYFGHKTSSYKASLNSLIGEADLSFVPVVLNKNAYDTASEEWEAAQQVFHAHLEPLVRQLLRRREYSEPTDEERLRAMQANDIARRALDQLAAQAPSLGRGGHSIGRRPPTARGGPDRVAQETPGTAAANERQPRTPPPRDAVGKLARKGISVEWDVRALDPRIRSARVVEAGRSEIVINSRYPLYKQRRGDLLYMLETGLLEQLRDSEDGERSADEYVDQLTEAMYLAVTEITGGHVAENAA